MELQWPAVITPIALKAKAIIPLLSLFKAVHTRAPVHTRARTHTHTHTLLADLTPGLGCSASKQAFALCQSDKDLRCASRLTNACIIIHLLIVNYLAFQGEVRWLGEH